MTDSQSEKKEKKGSKLDNVEVKQLLSQCTFTHLSMQMMTMGVKKVMLMKLMLMKLVIVIMIY